jgi:hypothetical protein
VMLLCLLLEFIFNNMKHLFYLFLFLVSCNTIAQNKPKTYRFPPTFTSTNFNTILLNINIFQNKAFLDLNYLSIYNKTTNLNDNHYVLGSSYVMSNIKSVPIDYFMGPKIDSLNPTGATDFKSALGIGVINYNISKILIPIPKPNLHPFPFQNQKSYLF